MGSIYTILVGIAFVARCRVPSPVWGHWCPTLPRTQRSKRSNLVLVVGAQRKNHKCSVGARSRHIGRLP